VADHDEDGVAFWTDPVSKLVSPAAEPLVVRYFDLVDQRERALRKVHGEQTTPGSRGQMTLNPLAKYLLDLEGALGRLEQSLGIDPASRARLKLDEASASDVLDRLFRRARGEGAG
jgi:phage terminase small subunit